jgi:hypothetical protein
MDSSSSSSSSTARKRKSMDSSTGSSDNNNNTDGTGTGTGRPCLLLESADLIREVASFLVDDAKTLCRLSSVSKSCQAAVLGSPQVWKATCRHRWARKWGFCQRSKAALEEAAAAAEDGRWWRDKYQWQERDAKRTSITAEELHSLTFDFRFWLSQFWGQGNLLASGLKWTASQDFQFASRPSFQVNPENSWPGLQRGVLKGHPSGREDLEWFLDQAGTSMKWGKLPLLWPKGTVHRLETWGWEIRNANVCLRAMDSIVAVGVNENNEQQTGKTTTTFELVKNDESLWSDYLASLRRYPTDFGMPQEGIAFMEAPEEFWEFLQNRQRFPRLGIDEIVELEA